MAKIVLVHGYGAGLTHSQSPLPIHLGFSAFYEGLVAKEVAMFSWYQTEVHSVTSFLNPRFHYQTYQQEKVAAQSPSVLKSFKTFIEAQTPEIVVCHSLGSFLFLSYMKKYVEPSSIKKVVFVQADIPDTMNIPPNPNHIQFVNAYCPWDPALLVSKMLHGYTPAGLTGWRQPIVKNKLVPLFGHWHLHISSIAQKQFAQFVASL
ncbi:MAG: hypothetical protein QG639_586 [Patescibacteria group bacterium]|jgi:hypothetical protein|nr:hypothetical protein [Patescibacteria group bacterium]